MPYQNNRLPLGSLLQNAGLISNEQLKTALQAQKQYAKMRLGEILVLQEGIKAKTIDFFVNKWQEAVLQGKQFPLGYYLKKAYLLSEQQIETILKEQQYSDQKFGTLAVKKGWISQKTVDFFIDSLPLKPPPIMSLSSLEEYNNNTLHLEKKYANYSLILSRVLAWTRGNLYLTKATCQAFANSDVNIPAGSEINAVDLFIENILIKKWQVSEVAEYIRIVKQSLVNNPRCDSKLLLKEYRNILLSDSKEYQNTTEQEELLLLGVVSFKKDRLSVANIIYQRVFNQDFVASELSRIKPQVAALDGSSIKRDTASIPENLAVTSEKIASNLNHVQIEVNHQTEENSVDDRKPNINLPKLLTIGGSLLALSAIALLISLFLKIDNYYSSRSDREQALEPEADLDFALEVNKLEQFCDGIDFTDSSSSLSLISRLEKNQQLLEEFPDSCQIALDRLRIVAAPMLGRESRILEAVKNLCKIPEDSEMHLEAETWIKHWYNSPDWGEKTQLYLEDFAKYKNFDCPASHFISEQSLKGYMRDAELVPLGGHFAMSNEQYVKKLP